MKVKRIICNIDLRHTYCACNSRNLRALELSGYKNEINNLIYVKARPGQFVLFITTNKKITICPRYVMQHGEYARYANHREVILDGYVWKYLN